MGDHNVKKYKLLVTLHPIYNNLTTTIIINLKPNPSKKTNKTFAPEYMGDLLVSQKSLSSDLIESGQSHT